MGFVQRGLTKAQRFLTTHPSTSNIVEGRNAGRYAERGEAAEASAQSFPRSTGTPSTPTPASMPR